MKFPYGIADFYSLITEGYFYADRTDCITSLEEAGKHLLFLRPRRFGKSLVLSMLENYYDLAKSDEFERLFGRLRIGENPTPRHNQYFVMHWDFSMVASHGDTRAIEQALHDHINVCVQGFIDRYREHLPQVSPINPANALAVMSRMITRNFYEELRLLSVPVLERLEGCFVAQVFLRDVVIIQVDEAFESCLE